MRGILTLALLGGAVWLGYRWKRTVEEGSQDAEWRAAEAERRRQ